MGTSREKNFPWARRLRALRERAKRTQGGCAKMVPCSKRQWERWEAGEVPPAKNLPAIAHAVKASVAELKGEVATDTAEPPLWRQLAARLQEIYEEGPTRGVGQWQEHLRKQIELVHGMLVRPKRRRVRREDGADDGCTCLP